MNKLLSVIIPSYRDPYLHKTLDSLLENAEGEIEIIPVLDGYWPNPTIKSDSKIIQIHLGKNRGMRGAINAGMSVAKGDYVMRLDEHCSFDKGFDKKLTDNCPDNCITTAKRYFLDPVKWEVMENEPVEHEKLVIQGGIKFAGRRWVERDVEMKDEVISETMAMQGSMWVMPKKWWDDVIGELQTEGYGPLIQDSHEVVFKTWKAGGKLLLNKGTWFAHKHRSFARMHNNGTPENPANCDAGYKYALDVWREYYEKEIVPKWKI